MKTSLQLFLSLVFPVVVFSGCRERKQEASLTHEELMTLRAEQSRAIAAELIQTVGSLLGRQLEQGGAIQAIRVCADTAQAITRRVQEEQGMYVRRVSLKWRNPLDIPDEYETQMLERFAALKAEGKIDAAYEHLEVVNEEGGRVFRFMKPIFIQTLCLQCHGEASRIQPEVLSLLKEKYPGDRALGYKLGDLRGAVSVKMKLD